MIEELQKQARAELDDKFSFYLKGTNSPVALEFKKFLDKQIEHAVRKTKESVPCEFLKTDLRTPENPKSEIGKLAKEVINKVAIPYKDGYNQHVNKVKEWQKK